MKNALIVSSIVTSYLIMGCTSSATHQAQKPSLTETAPLDSLEERRAQIVGTWHYDIDMARDEMTTEQFEASYIEHIDALHVEHIVSHSEMVFRADGTARQHLYSENHVRLFEIAPNDPFMKMFSLDPATLLALQLRVLVDYTWRIERDATGKDHLILSSISQTSRVEDILINGEPARQVFDTAPLLGAQERSERDTIGTRFINDIERAQQAMMSSDGTTEMDMPLRGFDGHRLEINSEFSDVPYTRGPGHVPAPTQGPMITRRDLAGVWATSYDYTQDGPEPHDRKQTKRTMPAPLQPHQFYSEVELSLEDRGRIRERVATWMTFSLDERFFEGLDEECTSPVEGTITIEIVVETIGTWSPVWREDTYVLQHAPITVDQMLGHAFVDQVSIAEAFAVMPGTDGEVQARCAKAFESMFADKQRQHFDFDGSRHIEREIISTEALDIRDKYGALRWERISP